MSDRTDSDSLPFYEYAKAIAEKAAEDCGIPAMKRLTFEQIAESDLTFAEIKAEYGEETAINAGIARDPDTWELTEEDFARSRSMAEVMPELADALKRQRNGMGDQPEWTEANSPVDGIGPLVRIDLDLAAYFRFGGPDDWQQRLNDTLREAVLSQLKDKRKS